MERPFPSVTLGPLKGPSVLLHLQGASSVSFMCPQLFGAAALRYVYKDYKSSVTRKLKILF